MFLPCYSPGPSVHLSPARPHEVIIAWIRPGRLLSPGLIIARSKHPNVFLRRPVNCKLCLIIIMTIALVPGARV